MAMIDKLAVAGVGLLTSMAAQKVVQTAWSALTGEKPPNPNDPTVPASTAFTWAIASGTGLLVAQVFSNRYAARKLAKPIKKPVKITF
ncbi:MAG: DUF4235 domain-containing protein [Propionibacteriaceae bacterium]|jgi:hypothetical protein|nr:DUF4235 domain-containing protein [Propionibacteriaceae bacterium]